MASAFNLTAQLNIVGPNNLRPVISSIRRELSTLNTNINLGIDARTARDVRTVTTSLAQLNSALTQTAALSQQVSANLRNIQNSASSAQSATNNLAQGLNTVNNNATAVNRNIGTAASQMEQFGRQSAIAIRRFAAFAGVTGVLYGLTRAFNSAFDEFVKFDREVVKLIQVTGQSRSALTSVTDEVTRLSVSLGVSSNSLIEVTTTLAQAGLTANQTRTALEALAKASLAPSFDDLNATVEGSIALMRQFSISSSQLESALGSVNAVAAAFAVEAGDIITAIQRTGGVFASASKGVSQGTDALNEFVSLFTSVRATTRESAETIATGLRTIFTRIQRGSTINFLNDLGIKLTDLEGKFIGPYRAIEQLSRGLQALDPRDLRFSQIIEELGGFRQIGKVIPLIQQFAVAQEALKVAQRGSDSLTRNSIEAQLSLSNQFTKTREQFLALVRSLGESQTFKTLTSLSLGLANSLISIGNAFKPILPYLAILGAIKGTQAAVQFGGGFLSAFRAGGGAGAAGQTAGNAVTGGGGGRGGSGGQNVQANTSAVLANTNSLSALTASVNNLQSVIVNATNALGNVIRQSSGTRPLGFATGGVVPGSGSRDTVPAMLTPGEFVIRKKAVETIGAENLHRINRYASGGTVKQLKQMSKGSSDISTKQKEINKSSGTIVNDTDFISSPDIRRKKISLTNDDFATLKNATKDPVTGKYLPGGITAYQKTVWPDIFEDIAQRQAGKNWQRTGSTGRFGGKSSPVDLYLESPEDLEIAEVKFTGEGKSVSDLHVLSKLLRFKFQSNDISGFTPSTKDTVPVKPITVYEPLNKEQFLNYYKAQNQTQKFAGGGTVEEIAASKNLSLQDAILATLQEAGGIAGIKGGLGIASGNRTLDSILRANNIRAGKNLPEASKFINEYLQKNVNQAKLIEAANKVGIVGLQPFDYKRDIGPLDLGGKTSMIYVRGLSSKFADAVMKMREAISSTIGSFAENIQTRKLLGGTRPLRLDFDETLVSGADIYDQAGNIDIAGYSDLTRVKESLNKGTLTPLGEKLKKLIEADPSILNRISVLTARPQSNAELLSQKLNSLGLPISANKIIGTSGGGKAKADAVGDVDRLIDDNLQNVMATRGQNKRALQYSPIKSLTEEQKAATGFANIEGAVFEATLTALGATGGIIQNRSVDYANGLGPAAQYFPGIGPNWPTEVKRTLDSDSISDAKSQLADFYARSAKKMATGGKVDPKDTLEEYFTDSTPFNVGLAQSKSLSKDQRQQLAGKIRAIRNLRTQAPETLYSSISRTAFDKFASDVGLNKNPAIPTGTRLFDQEKYYGAEVEKIVGKSFSLPGFVSTSKDFPKAKLFLDNAARGQDKWAAMFTIKTKENALGVDVAEQLKGRNINVTKEEINPRTGKMETFYMNPPSSENEVILSPRSRFRVDNARFVDLMGNKNLWADIQQLNQGGEVVQLGTTSYLASDAVKAIREVTKNNNLSESEAIQEFLSRLPNGDIKYTNFGGPGSVKLPSWLRPYSPTSPIQERFLSNNPTIRPDVNYNKRRGIGESSSSFYGRRRFNIGGSVNSEDTVPALLTPGEFVINKKAAQRIGSQKLNQLNKADKIQGFNKGGAVGNIVQRFAEGGQVETNRLINQIRQFITVLSTQEKNLKSPARQQTIVGLESVIASVSLGSISLEDAAKQVFDATTNLSKILNRSGNTQQAEGIKALADIFADIRQVEADKAQQVKTANTTTSTATNNQAQQAATTTAATLVNVANSAKQTAGSFSLLNQVSPKLATQYQSISNFLGGTAGVIGTAATVIGSELPKLYATIDKYAETDLRLNESAAGVAGGIQQAGAQALTTSTSFRQAGFGASSTAVATLASSIGGAVSGYLKSREQKQLENFRISLADSDKRLEQLFQRIETAPNAGQRNDLINQAYQELGDQLDALGSTYENTTETFTSKIGRAAESISGAILQIAALRLAFGRGMSTGGPVYASNGMLVNYKPRGTDTIPAMLSPGEFVVNAKSTKKNIGILNAINKSNGGIAYLARGTRLPRQIEEDNYGPSWWENYKRSFSQFYNPYDNSQREANDTTGSVIRGTGRVAMGLGLGATAALGGMAGASGLGALVRGISSIPSAISSALGRGGAAAATTQAGAAASGGGLLSRLGGLNGLLTAGILGQTGYSFFTGSRTTEAQRERQARKVEQLREPGSSLNRLAGTEIRNLSTDQLISNVRRVDKADLKSRQQLESLTGADSNTLVRATVRAAQQAGQPAEQAVKDLIISAFQKNSSLAVEEQEALIQLVQAREAEASALYDRLAAGQELSKEETRLAKAYETVVISGRKALVLQDQQAQINERNNRVLNQVNNAAENFNNAVLTISAALNKASSTFSNSLNKIDIGVGSRLSGRSEFGALDTTNLDVLSNSRAYNNQEIRNASRSATSGFGFQNVRVNSSLGGSLGDVMENASVAMRELEINLPRVLQNLQNLQGEEGIAPPPEEISKFLVGAGIPQAVANEIGKQISDAASKATSEGKNISYADLAKDVPAFLKTTEIFKQVNELQINIIKQTNDALNAYRQKVKQAADALTEASKLSGDFARSRAEFKLQLDEAVGRNVTVEQRNQAVDQETLGITTVRDENNTVIQPGTTDINEVIRRRDAAERAKAALEEQAATADFQRATKLSNATRTQIQIINQANEAIRKFATDTTKATNVLNAIGERRQVLEARQGAFLDVLSNLDNPDALLEIVNRGNAVNNIRGGNATPRDLMIAARNFRQDTAMMDPETRRQYTNRFGSTAATYMRQQGVDENTIDMFLNSLKPENDPEIRRLEVLANSIVEGQKQAQEKLIQDQIDGAKKISDLLPKAANEFREIIVKAGQEAAAALRNGAGAPAGGNGPPLPRPANGAKQPVRRAKGGMIYAANGTLINFEPRGTDTVPAMLSPGEFVVNAKATSKHLPLLHAINDNNYLANGGKPYVGPYKGSPLEISRRPIAEAFEASRSPYKPQPRKVLSEEEKEARRAKNARIAAMGVDSREPWMKEQEEYQKTERNREKQWESFLAAQETNPSLSAEEFTYDNEYAPEDRDALINRYYADRRAKREAEKIAESEATRKQTADELAKYRAESDARVAASTESSMQTWRAERDKKEADRVAANKKFWDDYSKKVRADLDADEARRSRVAAEKKAKREQDAEAARVAKEQAETERIRQQNYESSRLFLLSNRSQTGGKLTQEEDKELAQLERKNKVPFMKQQASVAAHQELQRAQEAKMSEEERRVYVAQRQGDFEQQTRQNKENMTPSQLIGGLVTAGIYDTAGATDVSDKEIMSQPLTQAIGFVGDIATDPTTYVTTGAGAAVGKQVGKGFRALQAMDNAATAAKIADARKIDDALKASGMSAQLERNILAKEAAEKEARRQAAIRAQEKKAKAILDSIEEGGPATAAASEASTTAATRASTTAAKAAETSAPTVSASVKRGEEALDELSVRAGLTRQERELLDRVGQTQSSATSRTELIENVPTTVTEGDVTQRVLQHTMSGTTPARLATNPDISPVKDLLKSPSQTVRFGATQEELDLLLAELDRRGFYWPAAHVHNLGRDINTGAVVILGGEVLPKSAKKAATFSSGGFANGSDTIPAMLTPGEFVVNRRSAQANLGLLKAINNQSPVQGFKNGGLVNYLAEGGQGTVSSGGTGIGLDFSSFIEGVTQFSTYINDFTTAINIFQQTVQKMPALDFSSLNSSLGLLSSSMSALTGPINLFNTAATTFGNNLSNTASIIGALAKIPSTITITGRIDMPTNLTITLDGQTSDLGPALKSEIIDAVARGLKQGNPEINVDSLIDQR